MPNKRHKAVISRRFRFQYAAKFICTANVPGTSQTTESLLPGTYTTVVNVHNPNNQSVKLRAKVALGGKQFISKFVDAKLGPDEVTRYVCRDIREKFGLRIIHGAEGFLVIESSHSLDVIAVYTAAPPRGDVASIDVEHVPERQIVS